MAGYNIITKAQNYQDVSKLAHPCDMNNCRCTTNDSMNCMYYNNNEYNHSDWSNIQGEPLETPKVEKFCGGISDKSEKFCGVCGEGFNGGISDKSEKFCGDLHEGFAVATGNKKYIILAVLGAAAYYIYTHKNKVIGKINKITGLDGMMQIIVFLLIVLILLGLSSNRLNFLKKSIKLTTTDELDNQVNISENQIPVSGIPKLNWTNQDAASYLSTAIKLLGEPSFIESNEGGIVIWKNLQNSCFNKHMLVDESIVHDCISPHTDFFYSYINFEVPPEMIKDVIALSGSITYDPLKKLIRARCGSLEANTATLLLATQISEGNASLSYIQNNQLYKQYLKATQDPKKYKKMYDMLCVAVNNQSGNPLPSGYSPLSFPNGC